MRDSWVKIRVPYKGGAEGWVPLKAVSMLFEEEPLRPRAPRAAASASGTSGGAEHGRIVEFFFATNRKRAATSERASFTHERNDQLQFGAVQVSVPLDHKIGRLELPSSWWLFGFTIWKGKEDRNKHFVILRSNVLEPKNFVDLLRSDPARSAIVFVHGFNTTFDQACLRFAQISWDLQFRGPKVLFAWPSYGGALSYLYDRDSAISSREHFLTLVEMLRRDAGIETVHVLAHSMGNMVVLDALSLAMQRLQERPVTELVMAAPDVAQHVFTGWIGRVREACHGMTLYASSQDLALRASCALSQGPRAGDVPAGGPIISRDWTLSTPPHSAASYSASTTPNSRPTDC